MQPSIAKRKWVKKGKQCTPANKTPKVHHPIRVMIWAWIGRFGIGPLAVIKNTFTGKGYKSLLSQKFRFRKENAGRAWIFQHDNAWVHTAKVVSAYLQKKHINVTPWPPSSLDLSLIQNLWPILTIKVAAYEPKTKPQLISAIHRAWQTISKEQVAILFWSMPKRLTEVVTNKGLPTHYWCCNVWCLWFPWVSRFFSE